MLPAFKNKFQTELFHFAYHFKLPTLYTINDKILIIICIRDKLLGSLNLMAGRIWVLSPNRNEQYTSMSYHVQVPNVKESLVVENSWQKECWKSAARAKEIPETTILSFIQTLFFLFFPNTSRQRFGSVRSGILHSTSKKFFFFKLCLLCEHCKMLHFDIQISIEKGKFRLIIKHICLMQQEPPMLTKWINHRKYSCSKKIAECFQWHSNPVSLDNQCIAIT